MAHTKKPKNNKNRFYIVELPSGKFLITDRQLGHGIAETWHRSSAGRIVNALNQQDTYVQRERYLSKRYQAMVTREAAVEARARAASDQLAKVSALAESTDKARKWDALYAFMRDNDMIPPYWD